MSVLKYKHPTLGRVPVSGVTEDSSKLVKGPLRWTVTEGAQVLYRDNGLVRTSWLSGAFRAEAGSASSSLFPGYLEVRNNLGSTERPNMQAVTVRANNITVTNTTSGTTHQLRYPDIGDRLYATLATQEYVQEYVQSYFTSFVEEIVNGTY